MIFFRIFLALFLTVLAIWRTGGFSPEKIAIPLLEEKEENRPIEIPKTFYYLGQGQQTFVFESGDYVLKFFNRGYWEQPSLLQWFFTSSDKKKRWKERIRIYPEGYRLAAEILPEETGVIFVHVGKSETIFPTVEVIDRTSRHFWIDLNRVPFVLQKKGNGSFFSDLQNKKELDRLLDAYLTFHAKRIRHCVADYDRDFKHNYCWDGAKLQYIDSARFFYDENLKLLARHQHEWWKSTRRLRNWLKREAPDQVAWFDEKVTFYMTESFERK